MCIDMMDNTNQRARNRWSSNWADDRVSGFTLRQMLDAMAGSDGLHSWESNLFNIGRENDTRFGIPAVIDFYDEVRRVGKEQD